MRKVLAAADIGSNTVHLLVAEANNGSVRRISDQNDWLNLGEIVARSGEVPLNVQDRLVATLTSFKAQAKADKARGWYVFATEAIRKAKNRDHVLRRVEGEVGVKIDVISGVREAELGLKGVVLDVGPMASMVLVEVGGGSAQIARAECGKLLKDVSLPLGTGTLSALHPPGSKARRESLIAHVRDQLQALDLSSETEHMVCSGGVARGLWRALHPDGEREISIEELDYIIWSTPRLNLDQIIARFGVKPRRAATLLPGAIVLRECMRLFNKESMLVSRLGVREGAVSEMADGGLKPCPL